MVFGMQEDSYGIDLVCSLAAKSFRLYMPSISTCALLCVFTLIIYKEYA
jgi:hypothetical protein